MKIGIFQDVHANLPALKKAVEIFRANNCDKIFHVGDLIGIGPYPKETLAYAFSIKEMEFIMGNHDYLYPHGIPNPRPKYMSEAEAYHQNWTHAQIGGLYKKEIQLWEFVRELKLSFGRSITFQHYGFDAQKKWFKPHILHPNTSDLDKMFDGSKSNIIFYGHNHLASDFLGKCRYINLGSAGCFDKAEVRVGILEVLEDALNLTKYSVPYDDNGLIEAFELRKVPARDFILKNFITRKSM